MFIQGVDQFLNIKKFVFNFWSAYLRQNIRTDMMNLMNTVSNDRHRMMMRTSFDFF